jgi:hypothetical protein
MMRQRCYNPKNEKFQYYGGKGIRVCFRWERFENFLVDMGPRPPGMSLDRIDPNGHYEPRNCRWATHKQQVRNSLTYKLNDDAVMAIKVIKAELGFTDARIAEIFCVARSTVTNILNGKRRAS